MFKIYEDKELNTLVNEGFSLDNYLIEFNNKCNNDCVVIYFSSNGIFFPNDVTTYKERILHTNSCEWFGTRILNAKKHIFIRDVLKQFYTFGINKDINSIENLLTFLKCETEGMKIITIGSSSGGYMALLCGILLNAEKIFAFSPLTDIISPIINCEHLVYRSVIDKKNDEYYSRYMQIDTIVNGTDIPIVWTYPRKSEQDLVQKAKIIPRDNILFFGLDSSTHGVNLEKGTKGFINSTFTFLRLFNKLNISSCKKMELFFKYKHNFTIK